MTGESYFPRGREDPELGLGHVIDEHGFAEVKLRRNLLPHPVVQRCRVEGDAQRVAVMAFVICEDANDVNFDH
jgi:hypothetical protein